jgi:hypothetical protein
MIDKLFRRSSQQIIEMEEQLDKMMTVDTKNAPPDYLWPLYQKIELIMDQIVKLRARRQFIVNNLISDIGEMDRYEHKKADDNK